jgi:pimeloyl-ACP methyl ester carboxylesterase
MGPTLSFDPTEIRLPVQVIHGRRDTVAPPAHAEYWVETLEDANPVWVEDAGHLLIEGHVGKILDALAA